MEKSKLVEQLRRAIDETSSFCSGLGIDLNKIQAAYGFERIRLIDDAVDAILVSDDSKRKYLAIAGSVARYTDPSFPTRQPVNSTRFRLFSLIWQIRYAQW